MRFYINYFAYSHLGDFLFIKILIKDGTLNYCQWSSFQNENNNIKKYDNKSDNFRFNKRK